MLQLAAFVAFFTLANLWSGGKFKRWVGDWPGRSHYYSSIAALALGWGLFGFAGLLIGASFTLWRLPGWYGALDAGTYQGATFRDFAVMSLRGLAAFPFFLWALYEANADPLSDLDLRPLLILLAACVGQGVAYFVGNRFPVAALKFWVAEGTAGAIWGAAYALVLVGVR